MRSRIVALLAVLATCAPAQAAAPKPQIVDPPGDVLALGGGYDVVSALFATAGTKARVRGRTVYTPTRLVVTVTYADNVAADQYSAQVVTFRVASCGEVYLEVYGPQTYGGADCLTDAFLFTAKRAGKTLTVTLPFGAIGKNHLVPGVELSALTTWTNIGDPTSGYEPGDLVSPTASLDVATTAKPWVLH